MKTSILTKRQVKTFTKNIKVNGKDGRIVCNIRYDDSCGNGHNSFAITGDMYSHPTSTQDRFFECGGCIHDEISKHFPELKHLIKWHLMSSDEPMHYIANTLFHARNKTHMDKEIGEAVSFETKLKFENMPFTFKEQSQGFWNYLNEVGDFKNIEVEAVEYDDKGSYKYSDHYSLTGFIKENEPKKWYKAPFKTKEEANEFLNALQCNKYEFVKIPTKWCEAVTPNLEHARSTAIWEDATLEQLQNEELLKARLPQLLNDFIADIEAIGFVY